MKRWFIDGDDWGKEPKWGELKSGELEIIGDNLATNVVARMPEILAKHGALVGRLTLECRYMDGEATLDFTTFEFPKSCPNLRYLWIKGGRLNVSALELARLEQVVLSECGMLAEEEIHLAKEPGGAGSALEQVSFENTSFAVGVLSFGGASNLRDFSWRLEIEGRNHPDVFRFEDCEMLTRADLDIAGSFEVQLAGRLGRVEEVRVDSGKEGQVGLDTSELESASFNLVQKIYV